MAVQFIRAKVDELSINFDDYTEAAREKYEGTHVFVGVHVPIAFAEHLTCSTVLSVGIETSA